MIYVVGDKHVADNRCSEVAQWWSRRLLTARSRVRAPPSEPFLSQNASELAGVAELADAQDLKSCDPYRSYRFDPGLRHQFIFWRTRKSAVIIYKESEYTIIDIAG